jgi:hypothetical protein
MGAGVSIGSSWVTGSWTDTSWVDGSWGAVDDVVSPVAGEGEIVLSATREVYTAGQRVIYKALERETYSHPKRNAIKSGSRE